MILRRISVVLFIAFVFNFGIPPSHSMDLSDPGAPVVCSGTETVSVGINMLNVRHPIYKSNFGGKVMKETGVYTMYKNMEHLAKLSPGFWIWTQSGGNGSRYRWDTHEALDGGYEAGWPVFKASNDGAVLEVDGANKVALEYWKSTDMRHCAYVSKVAGSDQACFSAMFSGEGTSKVPRYDARNVRVDFMVDEDVDFVSDAANPWCMLVARNATNTANNYKVHLDQNLRIHVTGWSTYNGDNYYETALPPSAPLSRGQWHTLEVYYLDGSTSGAIRYYLDGVEQSGATGLNTATPAHTGTFKYKMGCAESLNSAGKIYFDAVRISDSYIGTDPGDPRDFIAALHFDSSAMTLDDFALIAEQAGMEAIMQIGMFPPNTDHDYMTPQYSADMIEYLNGTADADYAARAAALDYSHNTPSDNWANLRAARGHIAPYAVPAALMASEPYWCEGWPKDNPALYAQACLAHATKIKETFPNVHIGVHLYNGANWSETVLAANKDIMSWACVQHDYAYEPGVETVNQVPRLLGIAAASNYNTGVPYLRQHSQAQALIEQYLAHRPDVQYIPTMQDEHGFRLTYNPGQGADLGQAIYRLGYRLETIEQAGQYAWDGDWLVINDRGYTYGVIGSDSLTPSYWAYRLFYEHFGTKYVSVTTNSPTYAITSYLTGEPLFTTPYVSVYASLNDDEQVLNLIVINRHQTNNAQINFNIVNFLSAFSSTTGTVYKIGGAGKTWDSHNLDDPDNVMIEESTTTVACPHFSYTVEPVSITVIEICRRTPTAPKACYLGNNQLRFFWNAVPNVQGYVLEWGPSAQQPYGGTAEYPGGYVELPAGTLQYNFTMDPDDVLYARLRAKFANGMLSQPSPVSEIRVLPQAANFRVEQSGNRLTFRWNAVAGAAGYLLSCGHDPDNLYEYQMDVGGVAEITIEPSVSGTFYFILTPYTTVPIYGRASSIVPVTLP